MGLIKNPLIRPKTTEILTFIVAEKLKQLTEVQKVNQKVVLSFYGNKIELPFKILPETKPITLKIDKAIVTSDSGLIQGYKLEMTHPLGKMYCRLDIPNEITPSQMGGDAYALADLNIKSKREFEDYLISRKQYDLDFSAMDLSHRQARLERKYEFVSKGIDLALGALSFGVSGWRAGVIARNRLHRPRPTINKTVYTPFTGPGLIPVDNPYYPSGQYTTKTIKGARKPIGFKGTEMTMVSALGAYKGASGIASGIAGLISASERASLQEESFGLQIREKALRSYEIDLSYEREKEDQLINMRRIFANESFNDVASRTRQKKLDDLEDELTVESPEIYLEFWTTSGEQESYVKDFHKKWGVDCRVAEQMLTIKNGIEAGIYCMEDPEILNLQDRVDFGFLKARLIGGIKFIDWVEHAKAEQLIPVDPRITNLQKALKLAEQKQIELEQDIRIQTGRYAEAQDQLNKSLNHQHELEDENRHLQGSNKDMSIKVESLSQDVKIKAGQILAKDSQIKRLNTQLETKTEEYHSLSEKYREKEGEVTQQKNLVTLYKQEKEKISEELQQCKQEKDTLTLQGDQKIKEAEELKQQLKQAQEELSKKGLDSHTYEAQNKQLLDEVAELKQQAMKLTTDLAQEKKSRSATNKAHRQQVNTWRSNIQKVTAENEQLKQQNQACAQQVSDLSKRLLEEQEKNKGEKVPKEQFDSVQRELEETKQTLQGVRAIKEQLEAGTNEEVWNKATYKAVMNYQPRQYLSKIGKTIYPYVITGGLSEGDNRIYICQFVREKMCYVNQPNLIVRKYAGMGMIRITDRADPQLLERNYALNNWHTYWSTNITTWKDLWEIQFKSGDFFNNATSLLTTNLPIRILDPTVSFPCFMNTPVSKEDKPIGEIFHYLDEEIVFGWYGTSYARRTRGVVRIEENKAKTVTNYGEYLEAMGLEAIEKDGAIEKVVAKKKARGVA